MVNPETTLRSELLTRDEVIVIKHALETYDCVTCDRFHITSVLLDKLAKAKKIRFMYRKGGRI